MARLTIELIRTAVLKSFEIGIPEAAKMFGIKEAELEEYRSEFIDDQYRLQHPAPVAELPPAEPVKPFWERVRHSIFYDITSKVVLAVLLILICWAAPYVLQPYVDPLTNSVVWLGFTAAYIIIFVGLRVELSLFVQHKVNFDFLNPFVETGAGDYSTLMRSNELTPYEKCRLNQQKYLSYLFAYCVVIMALASLMQGRL